MSTEQNAPVSTLGTSPANRLSRFWGSLPLSRKLLLAFGILFGFAAIIAFITLLGLNRTQTAYENTLAQGIEMRRLSIQLANSLLEARDNERTFIAHWRDEGFDRAYANYVTPHTQHVAEMREDLKQLALFGPVVATVSMGDITQAQYEADIASLTQNVDTYEKSFTTLVEAHRRKGFDNSTDFESQFRTAADRINAELFFYRASGAEQLQINFLRLRSSENNYLAYGNLQYVIEVHNFISLLKDEFATSDQFDPKTKTEMIAQADAYLTAFDGLVELDRNISIYNDDLKTSSTAVENLTAKIQSLGEQLATEDINIARSNSAQTFTISIITVFIVLAASILLAVTLSQQLTRPILSLTNTAREISAGRFDIQAQVNSTDEIGTLARTFNTMTGQLQDALQNLDNRAKELEQQTIQFKLTSQQSEKRAQQLQTIAEIAQNISAEKNLDKLLLDTTRTVSERFGFYHVGIFLIDGSRKFAVLSAANSEGGQVMLARGHKLRVGETGLVGYVTGTGKARIALDTGTDAVFFNNPDLPDTHSEMALPLGVGEEIIGALDVQSVETNAFSQDDINILSVLTNQIGIAIQNARQFEETRKALRESDLLSRQFVQTKWQQFTKSRKLTGILHTGAKTSLLYSKNGNDNGKDPLGTGQLKAGERGARLSLPLKLRGEVIGSVDIRASDDREWDQDELEIITTIIERAAFSMENARLLEESQKIAAKEHTIGDISSKIGAQSDVNELLKIAVQELGRTLPGMDIAVQLKKELSE